MPCFIIFAPFRFSQRNSFMGRFFVLSFCLCVSLSINGFGQADTLHMFFDADWKEITDPSQAEFRRVAYNGDDGYWKVRDFYKNGQVQMSGAFIEKEMKRYQGPFEWFYPNGKLKQKATYALGVAIGEDLCYYENGQIDTYRKFDDEGKILEEKLYKEDGSNSVLEKAEFPGGAKAMYRYIGKNTRHPGVMRRMSGKALVSFVVCKDGSLSNIEALDWTHEEFSNEATRVIASMPKWKPAMRDGKPQAIKYNLPVVFAP